ncbi:hypothetical protein ACFQE8_15440 [Salinirubellus sp. GCM10025818]
MIGEERSTTSASASVGDCPSCGGALAWEGRSWACEDCRFVPNHGAD